MSRVKIFICSQNYYLKPFINLFEQVRRAEDAEAIMFTGGRDVSPHLYGEPRGRLTDTDIDRDNLEVKWFKYAQLRKLPMLGICRGAQFLTVMAGGKLIQHVGGHSNYHYMETHDGFSEDHSEQLVMSSTHHQMMYPYDLDTGNYELLAWTKHRSKHYLNGWNKEVPNCGKPEFKEPEIVYYPKIRALGIQGHPEIMDVHSKGVAYSQKLVEEYVC